METIKTKTELKSKLNSFRLQGKSIGFVPTMGALHQGHLSLMQICVAQTDVSIASIFVNPTQFNDPADLKNYPRMPEKDFALLEAAGCAIVFYPEVEEMYPEPDTRTFEFGALGNVMEGAFRPGHFNGVAQVVSKLFDAVMPDKAYFGEKDFQQLAIIRQMVLDLKYNIEIVPCPIIREADGLAMSSRNMLLGENERKAAPTIYENLKKAKTLSKVVAIDTVKKMVYENINQNPFLDVEYFDIVDASSLQPIKNWYDASEIRACIAVQAGKVRLIDNIGF